MTPVILRLLPLIIFTMVIAILLALLFKPNQEKPHEVLPQAVIKPLPEFSLPLLHDPSRRFNTRDLKGKPYVLNLFASWCATCQIELPLLLELKKHDIPVVGITWKDKPDNTKIWLETHGNPYDTIGVDQDGMTVISLGITGLPETMVVNADGNIVFHIRGPVTSITDILPFFKK